jgi:DNA-binding transcriptional regulator YbjK
MYTIVWKKYLPVIKILMKKATAGDQQLSLNKTDFEKDKMSRKTNVRFTFKMVNAIAQNASAVPPLGRELTSVLQEDSTAIGILQHNEYTFSMNSRYELAIHREPKAKPEHEATDEERAVAEPVAADEVNA